MAGAELTDPGQATRMATGAGFLAALDQSGGSTPGTWRRYGMCEDRYRSDADVFRRYA